MVASIHRHESDGFVRRTLQYFVAVHLAKSKANDMPSCVDSRWGRSCGKGYMMSCRHHCDNSEARLTRSVPRDGLSIQSNIREVDNITIATKLKCTTGLGNDFRRTIITARGHRPPRQTTRSCRVCNLKRRHEVSVYFEVSGSGHKKNLDSSGNEVLRCQCRGHLNQNYYALELGSSVSLEKEVASAVSLRWVPRYR